MFVFLYQTKDDVSLAHETINACQTFKLVVNFEFTWMKPIFERSFVQIRTKWQYDENNFAHLLIPGCVLMLPKLIFLVSNSTNAKSTLGLTTFTMISV